MFPRNNRQRAFTIIELLIGLSIAATLLAACAMGVHASLMSYKANSQEAAINHHARTVIAAMLHRMRMTDVHSPVSSDAIDKHKQLHVETDASGKEVGIPDHGVTMTIQAGVDSVSDTADLPTYTYEFDPIKHRLTLQVGNSTKTTVLNGVKSFDVRFFPAKGKRNKALTQSGDEITIENQWADCLSVTLVMFQDPASVASGAVDPDDAPAGLTVTASARPRQSAWTNGAMPFSIQEIKLYEAQAD